MPCRGIEHSVELASQRTIAQAVKFIGFAELVCYENRCYENHWIIYYRITYVLSEQPRHKPEEVFLDVAAFETTIILLHLC